MYAKPHLLKAIESSDLEQLEPISTQLPDSDKAEDEELAIFKANSLKQMEEDIDLVQKEIKDIEHQLADKKETLTVRPSPTSTSMDFASPTGNTSTTTTIHQMNALTLQSIATSINIVQDIFNLQPGLDELQYKLKLKLMHKHEIKRFFNEAPDYLTIFYKALMENLMALRTGMLAIKSDLVSRKPSTQEEIVKAGSLILQIATVALITAFTSGGGLAVFPAIVGIGSIATDKFSDHLFGKKLKSEVERGLKIYKNCYFADNKSADVLNHALSFAATICYQNQIAQCSTKQDIEKLAAAWAKQFYKQNIKDKDIYKGLKAWLKNGQHKIATLLHKDEKIHFVVGTAFSGTSLYSKVKVKDVLAKSGIFYKENGKYYRVDIKDENLNPLYGYRFIGSQMDAEYYVRSHYNAQMCQISTIFLYSAATSLYFPMTTTEFTNTFSYENSPFDPETETSANLLYGLSDIVKKLLNVVSQQQTIISRLTNLPQSAVAELAPSTSSPASQDTAMPSSEPVPAPKIMIAPYYLETFFGESASSSLPDSSSSSKQQEDTSSSMEQGRNLSK